MKERIIMHSDINHCFAQIEEMMFPELKKVPMAVGGSEEKRNGIILARNQKARSYGIKTAMTLREALKLCPNLHIVPPHYDWYVYYSEQVKDIYREYSDCVESYGIDEAWIDLTHSTHLFGDSIQLAKTIQQRIYNELGLTVSIGLSDNKIFAKLGSDLIKPSGFVSITKENVAEVVHPLPVDKLLMVGPATSKKLAKINIHTIGDLASTSPTKLKQLLGKPGLTIWNFAQGIDHSVVKHQDQKNIVKSIGNGITTPKDIKNSQDLKLVFQVLAESIASRAKELKVKGHTIQVSLRNTELKSISRQTKISQATNASTLIYQTALQLVKELIDEPYPLRSVSIKLTSLVSDQDTIQLDLFDQYIEEEHHYKLDKAMDLVRQKFGFDSIKRCSVLMDEDLTNFNPKGDHTVYPVSYF